MAAFQPDQLKISPFNSCFLDPIEIKLFPCPTPARLPQSPIYGYIFSHFASAACSVILLSSGILRIDTRDCMLDPPRLPLHKTCCILRRTYLYPKAQE
jgi:hypothetical protein